MNGKLTDQEKYRLFHFRQEINSRTDLENSRQQAVLNDRIAFAKGIQKIIDDRFSSIEASGTAAVLAAYLALADQLTSHLFDYTRSESKQPMCDQGELSFSVREKTG